MAGIYSRRNLGRGGGRAYTPEKKGKTELCRKKRERGARVWGEKKGEIVV